MKVYIGPHTSWFGPYQLAGKLLFWMDKEDERVYNFGTWLATDRRGNDRYLYRFCNWIQSKKKRKIKVRIDEYDTWSMDHTLALIILPMLNQLKATKQGAPYVDDEDVPEHFRSTAAEPKENEWDTDSNHYKRWDWVIDEMIYSFEIILNDDWDLKIFEKYNHDWPQEALDERKAIDDRMDNGFRLFGKYYRALWD